MTKEQGCCPRLLRKFCKEPEKMFDARITFTGICCFVPDKAEPTTMWVLIPDGRGNSKKLKRDAADSTKLQRHTCFLNFELQYLKRCKDVPTGARIIHLLDCVRLTFETTYANKKDRKLDICETFAKHLANLPAVAPLHCHIDKGLVELPPEPQRPDNKLVAQVLIREGKLLVDQDPMKSWDFPSTLNHSTRHGDCCPVSQVLASDIILSFEGLTSLTLQATSFEDGQIVATWPLAAEDNSCIELTIANLCDENPLRWKTDADDPR